jgi:signal transduction histidine kinase
LRILLADDDPAYADAMEQELLTAGHEVRRAGDGVQVLEALREEAPDLLILDLVLPRLRGEAIIAAIKQDPLLGRIPVIVLSGALVERGPAGDLQAEVQIPKGPIRETARDLLAAVSTLHGKVRGANPRRRARRPSPRRQVSELLRMTAHHEAIMDSLAHGLLEVDRTGKILWSNSAAERILNIDRSALLGSNVLDLIPGARDSRLPRLFAEALEASHPLQPCYLATEERTLKIQMVHVPGTEDETTLTLLLQDLTLETTLDRRKADLLRYACHEMRGALTPISAALGEALQQVRASSPPNGPNGTPGRIQDVKEEVQRLLAMIEDLRAVAGNESQLFDLQLQPTDLREIVERVVSLQRAHANTRGVRIRVEMPERVAPILGNRDKLYQVLHNLLGNAIRYSPTGDEIQVRIEARGGGLVTTVEDRGPGIAPQRWGHLFQTFHLGSGLHRDHGGLGLAISKGILDAHRGLIWVEEAAPRGARLRFFLPTLEPTPE